MKISRFKTLICSTTILGLGLASPVLAADDGTTSATADAEAPTSNFGDIVVTAQRRSELQRDVPISITVLNADQLASAGITNTTDLGRVTPGVALPYYGAFLLPSIRGISSNGSGIGDSPNVAMYVDGVYQASQSGMNIDLPDVQSVQVLKGPQGSLYGQNAAGGAIIIDTIAPSFTWAGKVAIGYGNANDMVAKGYVTGPLSQTLAMEASAAYQNRDGFNRDLVRGGHDKGLRSHSFRGKLLWEPNDTASLTVQGFYSSHRDTGVYSNAMLNGNSTGVALSLLPCAYGGYACLNLPVATKPHTFAMNIEPDTQVRTYGFSAHGKLEIPGAGTFTTVTAYNNNKAFDVADTDGSPLNIVDFYLHIKEHDFVQELNFASEKFGPLTLNAGLFYLSKTETYAPYYADIGVAPYSAYPDGFSSGSYVYGSTNRYGKHSYAAYLEANVDLTDKLQVSAAGRYSIERALAYGMFIFQPYPVSPPYPTPTADPRGTFTFKKFTPRLVVRYKPDNDTTLYASYSKGFKSGYVDTSNINNNGCFTADCIHPPVKPEIVDAYEVGFKGKIAGILDVSLAAFHYTYKNIQIFSFSPPNNSFYQNAASARINGFEFSTDLRVSSDLTLSVNGTYLDAKYKNFPNAVVYLPNGFGNSQSVIDAGGNPLMRTPKWTINGSLSWKHETPAGTFGLYVSPSYNSGMSFDVGNRVRQREYALLDGEISFAPSAFDGLKLVVWGKNLTNHNYLQSVLESQLGDGVSFANPRTYGVRAEYSF